MKESLGHKIEGLNADISFLQQLVQPPFETILTTEYKANNMGSLAQMLRMKNSKFVTTEQTRKNGLQDQGGDLMNVLHKIKEGRLLGPKQESNKSECQFHMDALTYENQNKYIKNNYQLGVLCTVQSIMSDDKRKGNLCRRMLNRRAKRRQNKQQSYLDSLPVLNLQIRNGLKKIDYLKATAWILSLQQGQNGLKWTQYYGKAARKQFWQILHYQLSFVVAQPSKQKYISKLALASLELVQKQLSAELPYDHESIKYVLTNKYLGKMKGKYDIDGVYGPVWGICFLLYRAGRQEQMYALLSPAMVKSFEQAQKSIKEGNPKRVMIEQGGDVFYNQLMHALKGQTKCQNPDLCNPNNLDIAWIFLRQVGIFPDQLSSFLNLRKDLYQLYKNSMLDQVKIKNLLYLLAYGEIAELGPNDMMDQDDFVHYLIAIYRSPLQNSLSKDKKDILERRLTQQLVQYIQELLLQHREQYINYMVLLPSSKKVQQISSIIASSHLLQTINWSYLATRMQPALYRALVQESMKKHVAFYQDYIQAARKQCQLLGDYRKALDYLLQMLVKLVLVCKMDPEQWRRGISLAGEILGKDDKTRGEYAPVFNFFDEFQRARSVIQQRNPDRAYSFLQKSMFILLSDQLTTQTRLALQKLMENRGFECYIHFLRNMVKIYEIAFLRMNKDADLQEISNLTLGAIIELMRNQPYSQYANLESFKELLRILEESCEKRFV